MKIIRESRGHTVECQKCGTHYLVEQDDVKLVMPFDPVAVVEEAKKNEDDLKRWDSYCGRRMYYRFWECEWTCPGCGIQERQEMNRLPRDWWDEIFAKAGCPNVWRPLEHPSIHEIDRLNYERFLRNLATWQSKSWLFRSRTISYVMFGDYSGARDHAYRNNLPAPRFP